MQMTTPDFTTTLLVDQSPAEVFAAINNVRGWWSEEIEGGTSKLNDEFDYHFADVHKCKMKLVEVVPDIRVVWLVLDNYFKFTKDSSEWKGTNIVFDIAKKDNQTEIRFTHKGLVPEYECYDVCKNAWTTYIQHSLGGLITTGKGHPNAADKPMTQDEKNLSTGSYAFINGLKMYYEIYGEGMPLVLIHGGGSTIDTTFGRVKHLFAETHKVIAVELQAHGRTADVDRPLSFVQDADDVAGLLRHLNIEKADICGFSNGASTTLQLAIRHPQLVNRIVVASTFYKRTGAFPWFWDMMAEPTFEGMPQQLKDAFLELTPDTDALYRMYERDVARMRSFPDISDEEIRSIKAPAFIIIGDKDVVTAEHAVEMHRLLDNSRLAILPGGHGEYIGEITTPHDDKVIAATVSLINNFLADEPDTTR